MTNRTASVERNTLETQISVSINLDGTGKAKFDTGVPFLEHMLDQIARHGLIDMDVYCKGDVQIDDHHTVEDIGITLGKAFAQALGDKKGINRYGSALIPMDETLVRCVLDFSGRTTLILDLDLKDCNIEDVAVEDIKHFFNSFAENAKLNLHIHVLYGEDQHHKVEAVFKALARAIKKAKKIISDQIPSTKGKL